jgi:hypothetical protein
MKRAIEAWEDEGGAVRGPLDVFTSPMSGTASPVERVERNKRRVNEEFERVTASALMRQLLSPSSKTSALT